MFTSRSFLQRIVLSGSQRSQQHRRFDASCDTSSHPPPSSPGSILEVHLNSLDDPRALRTFMNRLGPLLGISPSDYKAWYQVSVVDILRLGYYRLFEKETRLLSLLRKAYPEHSWTKASSAVSSSQVWIIKVRRELEKYAKEIGLKDGNLEAWYEVPNMWKVLSRSGLGNYGKNRFDLLQKVYPEHTWHPWLFPNLHDKEAMEFEGGEALKNFLRYLEETLKIERPEDWYRINKADLVAVGLRRLCQNDGIFRNQSDVLAFLRKVYPEVKWDPEKMSWSTLGWSKLRSVLEQLLHPRPVALVREEDPNDNNPSDGVKVTPWDQFFCSEDLKLCFEYQGPITYAEQIIRKEKYLTRIVHSEKLLRLSEKTGATPISVPFWWDRQLGPLLAEIYQSRKDLFEQPASPLASYCFLAASASPIPSSVLRRDLKMNQGHLKQWYKYPHLRPFFESDPNQPKSFFPTD